MSHNTYQHEKYVVVFGANLAGRHGRGAARDANRFFGARRGLGEGRCGMSYAIPIKDKSLGARFPREILSSVDQFLEHAAGCPQDQFFVTRLGTGLAGLRDRDMAAMFKGAPGNVWLPRPWYRLNGHTGQFFLIVGGDNAWQNYGALSSYLDHVLSAKRRDGAAITILSGTDTSADAMGERYAQERSLDLERWPPAWGSFHNDAACLRDTVLVWRADALAWFSATGTPAAHSILEKASQEGLAIREHQGPS